MFVTSVRHTRRSSATSWRPAWKHDLDVGVGEDVGERAGVEVVLERVEHLDADLVAVRLLDRDLDEAEQRAVAALAHELGVDAQPSGLRARCARSVTVASTVVIRRRCYGRRGGRRAAPRSGDERWGCGGRR